MHRNPLTLLLLIAAITLPLVGSAQSGGSYLPPKNLVTPEVKPGQFVFSILPKSFQRNPTLDMTFNTDFTEFGRLLRPASPEHPVYYVSQDAGYHQLGGSVGGESKPKTADMDQMFVRALATNGFLPATAEHRATLVLIYTWGSHNLLPPHFGTPDMIAQNVLERSVLVGGRKFLDEMSFYVEWGYMPPTGLDPLKLEQLQYQAAKELYYVVASAYDYDSMAHGKRQLAWRTTMTVNSTGVGLTETMPPLIANAAPFFGRETTEPEFGSRKMTREGRVDVGTPTVMKEKTSDSVDDGKSPVPNP